MTTPGDNPWFAKTPAEIRAAIDARPENWQLLGMFRGLQFSRYEISDKGGIRRVNGQPHATRPQSAGYVQTSITSDDGKRIHPTMQTLVLTTFDPRCADGIPAGLESRHGPAGPQVNAWPENLDIGTPRQNAADRPEPGGGPQFPCRNAPACGNLVINEGRRCQDCVSAVGRGAAARLNAGVPLEQVAGSYGNSEAWIYRLAVEHGGYEGTIVQARQPAGRPLHESCDCPGCRRSRRGSWWHRVTVTLRARLSGGDSA